MNFILVILISVVGANLSIIFICLVGVLLVITEIIDMEFISFLGKMLEKVFVPSLIITSFLKTITIRELWSIIPIIFSASFVCVVGGVIGLICSKFWIRDQQYRSIVILACSSPHTASIQLQITFCLQYLLEMLQKNQNYESTVDTTTRAITTIMIFSTVNNTYRWTIGKYIFESYAPKDQDLIQPPTIELQGQNQSNDSTRSDDNTNIAVGKPTKLKKLRKVLIWISEISMPMLAICLSLVIVCVYPIQIMLLDEESFLHQALFQPLDCIGKASTPCNLIMLGANMCTIIEKGQKNGDGLDKKICQKITFIKLVVVPIFGALSLYIMVKLKILDDPVVIFVSFLTYSTPIAVNMLIQIKRYKGNEDVVSLILVYSYISAIITLPIWIILFFSSQM